MASKSIPQPSASTFLIHDLMKQVRLGRIRIPEFQRPLRWQWEDVRRLFDSIVKGYPVGSLLLWKHDAPAARVTLGGISLDAPHFSEGLWVVDGQQRLTSLANALGDEADERFALAYDLNKKDFVRPPPIEEGHIVPLPVLFDLQRLLRWFSSHPEISDKLDDAAETTKAIRQFSIPAYVVEQQDEAVLRDIFDRMNNYGRRLSRAEIFSALHPSRTENSDEHSSFANIIDRVERDLGFGQLDADTVLRAVLARRGGDVTREIRDEFSEHGRRVRDFGEESEEDAYRGGERAIVGAIKFLRGVGVPHVAFLPYRYLLTVLTRFFAHFPDPDPRNLTLLQRWFWRASMLGPNVFKGGWTDATRTLALRITAGQESASVQRLLESPISSAFPQPDLKHFRTSRADSRVALCAMWSLHPQSPSSGEAYSLSDLLEAIPAGGTLQPAVARIFGRDPVGYSGWAANRTFLLGEEPTDNLVDLLSKPRVGMVGESFQEILRSHAMTRELAELLADRNIPKFLEQRQLAVEDVVRSFLVRLAAPDFEDTPPLDSYDLDDEGEERVRP